MQDTSGIHSTRHCTTADEFLEYLHTTHDRWADSHVPTENPWIYRGHWDSQWKLIPSAWRVEGDEKLALLGKGLVERSKELAARHAEYLDSKFIGGRASAEAWTLQHLRELEAARSFLHLAERQGLEVPNFKEVADRIPSVSSSGYQPNRWWYEIAYTFDYHAQKDVFCDGTWETLALAQHHGIPTRLLDRTRDFRIAAFFAAADDQRNEKHDGRIAVWAVNTRALPYIRVEVLQIPRYKNSFLHAQEGLFTYFRPHELFTWWMKNPQWPSLLDLFSEWKEWEEMPSLRCATLPQGEADKLLFLLQRQNITKARLMPTYDSVAKAVKISWRLNNLFGGSGLNPA